MEKYNTNTIISQTGKFVLRDRDLGRAKFFALRVQARKIRKIASGAQNSCLRRARNEKLCNFAGAREIVALQISVDAAGRRGCACAWPITAPTSFIIHNVNLICDDSYQLP